MTEQSLPSRLEPAPLPAVVLLLSLGLAQAVLVILAFTRTLDPGWVTVGAIGTLVGLGMASVALTYTISMPSRNRSAFMRFGVLGILAGLVLAGVWLSLFGGTFYTYDLGRVGAVIACDVLFTVWLVAAARLVRRDQPLAGLYWVATLMTLRAIGEILLFLPLVMPSDAGPGPNLLVVFVAGLVLFGWVLLALWEIALGAWLLRRARARSGRVRLPGRV